MGKPADKPRMDSWKEIAAHLGCDQRTAKRWEKTRGLPVHRLPGARSGVFAFEAEIDAWKRQGAVEVRAEAELGEHETVDAEDAGSQQDEVVAEGVNRRLPGSWPAWAGGLMVAMLVAAGVVLGVQHWRARGGLGNTVAATMKTGTRSDERS